MDRLRDVTSIKSGRWPDFYFSMATEVLVMFGVVGGVVVYGFACYGFARFLMDRNVRPDT
jgi:hypothetical protein